MGIDLSSLSDEELIALRDRLSPEKPSKEEEDPLSRSIARRVIPAVKGFLTAGIAPQLLDPVEEKLFGKKYRARNKKEEDQARFYQFAGSVPTLMTGAGGVMGAAGKGLFALSKVIKGSKLLKAAGALTKAGKATKAARFSAPEIIGSGIYGEDVAPLVDELPTAVGIPVGMLAGAGITGGLRNLNRIQSLPAKALGIDPEIVKAFKKADVPYTLGDVSPRMASVQNAAHQLSHSKKINKIYSERKKTFEKLAPTKLDVKKASDKITPALKQHAAMERAKQATLAKEFQDILDGKNIQTFTPSRTQQAFKNYQESLAKSGAKGAEIYDLPDSLKEVFRETMKDSIPFSRANKAKGLFDKLDDILPEHPGAQYTKEQGLAASIRKALADDIVESIENVSIPAGAAKRAAKKQWANWMTEKKFHKKFLTEDLLPSDRLRKLSDEFIKGGETLPQILSQVPKNEQKDFFNFMVRALGTNRGNESLIYFGKRFNNLSKENQKFLLKNMEKYNKADKDTLNNLFEALSRSKITENNRNTSGTSVASAIYAAEEDLMKGAKNLLEGNKKGVNAALNDFGAKTLGWIASKAAGDRLFGSQNTINRLNKLNMINHPSKIPAKIESLQKGGLFSKIRASNLKNKLEFRGDSIARKTANLHKAYQGIGVNPKYHNEKHKREEYDAPLDLSKLSDEELIALRDQLPAD